MTLELSGATYRYAGYATEVLHEVDLRIGDGEIVGLVGPNEAGKSTLCLVASGLAPASIGGSVRGTVALDGESAAGLSTHELAERVVVGFQNPNTQRSGIAATVFEEIALGPMNLGLPVEQTVERTHEAIGRLRLEPLVRRDPQRLSGGPAPLVAPSPPATRGGCRAAGPSSWGPPPCPRGAPATSSSTSRRRSWIPPG